MSEVAVNALRSMDLRPEDAWMRDDPVLFGALIAQAVQFPSFVLPDPSRPVVVCGIVPMFGVAEIWMVSSPDLGRHAATVIRVQRRLIADLYKALGLHCLHMRIDTGREDAQRWARVLGFSYEATLARRGVRGNDVEEWIWNLTEGSN